MGFNLAFKGLILHYIYSVFFFFFLASILNCWLDVGIKFNVKLNSFPTSLLFFVNFHFVSFLSYLLLVLSLLLVISWAGLTHFWGLVPKYIRELYLRVFLK